MRVRVSLAVVVLALVALSANAKVQEEQTEEWFESATKAAEKATKAAAEKADKIKAAAEKATKAAAENADKVKAAAEKATKAAAEKAAKTAAEKADKVKAAAEKATKAAAEKADKLKEKADKALAKAEKDAKAAAAALKEKGDKAAAKAKEAAEKAEANVKAEVKAKAKAAAALAQKSCGPGNFYTAPLSCKPCAAGRFSDKSGQTSCAAVRAPCPAGTFVLAEPTRSSDRACRACAAGSFTDAPNAGACSAWRKCTVAGEGADPSSPNGSASADRVCSPCELGKTFASYHAYAGNICSAAMKCLANEWEFRIATTSSDRVCATHSARCPALQYTTSGPVAANHATGKPGRDRLCEAITVCDQGEFQRTKPTQSSDRVCEACAAGTFKATRGNAACAAWRTCAVGSGLAQEGDSTQDRKCAPCEAGTFSDTDDGASCRAVSDPCTAGHFMDNAPTAASDRTCAPCAPKSFKAAAGNEACDAWQTCGAGLGITAEGTAVADRQCAPCTLGKTFSAVDDASPCRNVRSPCTAGTFIKAMATLSSDLVCEACAAGTFSPVASQFSCAPWRTCPAGQGKITEGTATSNRECEACATVSADHHPYKAGGSYSVDDSGDACAAVTPCTVNEFMTQPSSASSDRVCTPHTASCPEGQYTTVGVTPTSDRECSPLPLDAVAAGKAVKNDKPGQRHATQNANYRLTVDQFGDEQNHADVEHAVKEDLPSLVHDASAKKAAGIKLGRCEGDCDSDADCATGHTCHQRTLAQAVPGCEGIPVSEYEGFEFQAVDYCVRNHDLEGIAVGKNIADVDKLGDNEPFKSRSSTGGGIGIVETKVSFAPEKPAYWYRGYDGVERGCTPGMHRALHTTCRTVEHVHVDELTGERATRKVIKVHHNPWARHYVDTHQHKCLFDDVLNKCVCCDSFIMHTGAPTPAPNAVDEAVAAGLSIAAAQSLQCRFPTWTPTAPSKLISRTKWGGNTGDITFHRSDSAACSTGHDSDAAVYLKKKVSGAFEFSFTYDDAAGAHGGINRFMAGLWIASDPAEFQSTYPENNADGPRYFFSTETNSVYYSTNPGRNLERKFTSRIFLKGARMTLARHADCKIVLYQNEKVWHTFKAANCNDGYVWLGHYADVKDGSHYDRNLDEADISCVTGISLCNKPAKAGKATVPKGPRCKVVRNRGPPKTGAQLEWAGQVQSWDATKSAACAGANAGAMHLKKHVWGNFEFGFTYDGLDHSTNRISRLFAGFWQAHDKDVSSFDPSNPMQSNVFGPRYVYSPLKNELLFANRVEHRFETGDYKGYKNEMSLVPGYKKPRARMMLVRYNGHVSLFKNGWRMYEWSEEDHKDGFIWMGHFADKLGQFCVEDVYLCN